MVRPCNILNNVYNCFLDMPEKYIYDIDVINTQVINKLSKKW